MHYCYLRPLRRYILCKLRHRVKRWGGSFYGQGTGLEANIRYDGIPHRIGIRTNLSNWVGSRRIHLLASISPRSTRAHVLQLDFRLCPGQSCKVVFPQEKLLSLS